MILPHPETDFSINILVVSADIIKDLKNKKGKVLVESVMQSFLKQDIKRSPDLFWKCLVFLYSIGLVDYENYKLNLTPKSGKHYSLFE